MEYLDFELEIKEISEQIIKLREIGESTQEDFTDSLTKLENKLQRRKKEIYGNLSIWQKVQLSRHPSRPYTLEYIEALCGDTFIELHGDRSFKDDKAMVGGMGEIDGQPVIIFGQQKGINTKMRQYRNFGMPNPEGYRKALRLMKMAEKFNIPIISLIDTPGAYCGPEAEERGQGEAIARNIYEMFNIKVPIICIIIGEGASGGALGIGVGDRVFMLQNTWYTVISPENCSSILWRSWDYKVEAAEALQLTADDVLANGLIDAVIPEPLGGAHYDPKAAAKNIKEVILKELTELKSLDTTKRLELRREKFEKMGEFIEG